MRLGARVRPCHAFVHRATDSAPRRSVATRPHVARRRCDRGPAVVVAQGGRLDRLPVSWGTTFADPIDDLIEDIRDNSRWLTQDVNDFIVRDLWVRSTSFLRNTVAWPILVLGAAAPRTVGEGLAAGAVLRCRGVRDRTRRAVGPGDRHPRPSAHGSGDRGRDRTAARRVARSPPPRRGGGVTVPRRDADDPVARLRDPVRDDLRRRHRAGRHGRAGSVLYAIPPGVRVSALGVRQVPESTIEAATTFGASRRQVSWGVRIPLACRRSCSPSTR